VFGEFGGVVRLYFRNVKMVVVMDLFINVIMKITLVKNVKTVFTSPFPLLFSSHSPPS
jgi:hypothetical protein